MVCRSRRSGFSGPEAALDFTVILPRSGVFVGRIRGRRVLSDANTTLFLNPNEPYRVSHPVDGGDRCTNIRLGAGTVREILRNLGQNVDRSHAPRFEVTHGSNESAIDLQHRRLIAAISLGWGQALAIEEEALGIAASALASAYRTAPRAGSVSNAKTTRRHRALTESAKEVLATSFSQAIRLADVASEIGCSPYHLC